MDRSANGRVALVTGAAQGIGKEIALALGTRGYSVVLNDLREASDTLAQLSQVGVRAITALGDVSSETDVRSVVARALDAYGRVDVLVNNAGISHISPAQETTLDAWQRVLAVNLTGPFLLCREV